MVRLQKGGGRGDWDVHEWACQDRGVYGEELGAKKPVRRRGTGVVLRMFISCEINIEGTFLV
ncbi:hypothetical protein GKA01_06510 [Gluconobacter kanchanaburiensis NBRC 103587]|uniref:Uncharacterized protein n=1 Tax=Gluconobacter kanchanaburiensis NBRC 103587 TaxID=1307948 RepID=A0A511B506_9PROT|nr:hypothetical protein AA103587_0374 [Gluconobacter kanchanaburiensis NBRC 103587]GEK95454.1 hypothetical protein GKA01_06510 [Gluconobacter kanchanaburiensis NBRC 103587]